jgi:hypothetical protein
VRGEKSAAEAVRDRKEPDCLSGAGFGLDSGNRRSWRQLGADSCAEQNSRPGRVVSWGDMPSGGEQPTRHGMDSRSPPPAPEHDAGGSQRLAIAGGLKEYGDDKPVTSDSSGKYPPVHTSACLLEQEGMSALTQQMERETLPLLHPTASPSVDALCGDTVNTAGGGMAAAKLGVADRTKGWSEQSALSLGREGLEGLLDAEPPSDWTLGANRGRTRRIVGNTCGLVVRGRGERGGRAPGSRRGRRGEGER